MNIEKFVNKKISGLYDIGKEYSLDLYWENEEDKAEIEKALPKNNKKITITELENGFQLRSFNLTDILNFQKSRGLKFPLEHL